MKKRGRPRKVGSLRCSVSFACNSAEAKRLFYLARAEGLSISAFIRKQLKELGHFGTDQLPIPATRVSLGASSNAAADTHCRQT